MQVSVVVPTFHRNDLLKRCLDALARQDLNPSEYEIIIVDDGASEDTRQVVDEMAARANGKPAMRYVPMVKREGPASARNTGWRTARGKIIAFTDDDTIPNPGWLSAGIAAFADDPTHLAEPVHAVAGKIVVPLPDKPTDYERNAAGLQGAEFATANCFFRRDALAAIGGFDPDFKVAFREDSDVYFSLLENGGRVLYNPNAIVVHPVRPAEWGVSVKQQQKSAYDALLYKKHPKLFRRSVTPMTPWRYYGVLGALAAMLTGLTMKRNWLAALGTGVWLLLTGSFAAQRLTQTSHQPKHVAEMAVTSALIPPIAIFWRLYGALKYRVKFL